VAKVVVCQKTNGKTQLPICKDCWDGDNKIPGTTGKSIKTSSVGIRARGSAHATPSPAKRAKVKSPALDATTLPQPIFLGKKQKQIVNFASPFARGLDDVTSAQDGRVHGKSLLSNVKSLRAPTIDRKGQQKIIEFMPCTPLPGKRESNQKIISHQKHMTQINAGYIIPLGAPLYRSQRHQLYRDVGINPDCIDTDFELVNVSPNGNCALLVVQQFLHSTGREKNMTIMQFQLILFEYLSINKEMFQSVSEAFPHGWMYQNNQWDNLLSSLYKPGTNFDKGCLSSYWVDIMEFGPILAHKYHITVNIYGKQKVTVRYLEGLGIKAELALALKLTEAQHTLFCLFHAFHYYWIKPRVF
jgi:hypothetical protein